MKKARKILLTLCAALLLVTLSVGATVAYFTSSASVKNTFTIGNVKITMDEAKVDEYGVATEGRGTSNTYKLIPNHQYLKDPTIHVDAESEDCWLFAKINNGLGTDAVIDIKAENWTEVEEGTGLYIYKETVSANANVVVFEHFTTGAEAKFTGLVTAEKEGATAITVNAFAIQKADVTRDIAIDQAKDWAAALAL